MRSSRRRSRGRTITAGAPPTRCVASSRPRDHARRLRPAPRLPAGARRPAPPRGARGAARRAGRRRAAGAAGRRRRAARRAARARRWRSPSRCCGRSARGSGARREVIVVPGNHDAGVRAPVAAGARRDAAASTTADPARRDARARALDVVARRPRACASTTRASGSPTASGRRTGTTSIATCCPESAYGVARGLLGRLPRDGATPADYERAGGPSATRLEALLTRWLPRPLAELSDELAEFLRAATMPGSPRRAARPPARAVRPARAGRRRCAARASPRSPASCTGSASTPIGSSSATSTAAGRWPATTRAHGADPAASPRIANTGSWVYEPLLLHHVTPPHPYWPGGAIRLADGRRARADRPARPPRRRDPARPAGRVSQSAELEDDLAGRAALVDEPSSASAARSSGKRSPTIGATKPSSARRLQLGADLAVELGLAHHVGAPAGADDLDVVEQQAVDLAPRGSSRR